MRKQPVGEDGSLRDDLRNLRHRRDELRVLRNQVREEADERIAAIERELGVRDAMIASITASMPDLGDPSDTGATRQRVEIRPVLLAALVDANGSAVTVDELLAAARKRITDTNITSTQVRDGARYLAKTDARVRGERASSGRLSYTFRASSEATR